MTVQRLQVDPADLQRWAANHDDAAERAEAARADGAKVLQAAESWGPLFHEARRAAQEVVEARDAALAAQAARHRAMAAQLRSGGQAFAVSNEQNAANLGNIAPE